jgi:hypothetical protein
MFNDGYTDWHKIVPNMQTAAANVDYYVHEVKEEQKHSSWWMAGAFLAGLLIGIQVAVLAVLIGVSLIKKFGR